MSIDAEAIADRRRLRRKLSFWRVLGFSGLIAAVAALGYAAADRAGYGAIQNQIARISVDGVITGNQRLADLMQRVGDSSAVSGVVISINSPGGTTTGSEEIYRNIRRLAEKKPVVTFVDGTAASGGYITAIATDYIVARETSLVGSIGVLFQYPDLSGLMGQVGVKLEEVKSSPLKAEPSPFKPTSPEARAAMQAVVNDTYDWFKALVRDRRRLNEGELSCCLHRPGLQRPSGRAHEARRQDRRRARCGRLARADEGRGQGPADSRLEAEQRPGFFHLRHERDLGRSLRFRACGRRLAPGIVSCADCTT